MLGRLDRARLRKMGMRDDDFAIYRFGDDVPISEAPAYLGYELYRRRVRPALNDARLHAVTENKWIFYRLMAGFGLPVPETYGLYHRHVGLTWDGAPLVTPEAVLDLLAVHRPPGVVLKPAGGEQGVGVVILRDIDHDTGDCLAPDGDRVRLADVVADLPADEGRGGYPGTIVQRLAVQHPDLARINPDTPNTVRVLTLLTEGTVAVHRAVARIGRPGDTIDAWSHGGPAVLVDPVTGVMGVGITRPEHGSRRVGHHPETGVEITGRPVPRWDEVVEACTRAARLLPGVRSVGWDVLVTADGPLLLEGNRGWNLHLGQVHGGILADAPFRRAIEAEGIALPTRVPFNPLTGRVARRTAMKVVRRLRR